VGNGSRRNVQSRICQGVVLRLRSNRCRPPIPRYGVFISFAVVTRAAPYRELPSRDVELVVADLVRPINEDHMEGRNSSYPDRSSVWRSGWQSPWDASTGGVILAELVWERNLVAGAAREVHTHSVVMGSIHSLRGLSAPRGTVVIPAFHRKTCGLRSSQSGRFVTPFQAPMLQTPAGVRGFIKGPCQVRLGQGHQRNVGLR